MGDSVTPYLETVQARQPTICVHAAHPALLSQVQQGLGAFLKLQLHLMMDVKDGFIRINLSERKAKSFENS